MDIKGQGFEASVVAAEQTDTWLLGAAQEIYVAAEARGLEVPVFAGGIATEATTEKDSPAKLNSVSAKEVKHTSETRKTEELLFSQLDVAHRAHTELADALNTGQQKHTFEAAGQETVETEFTAWLSQEKLDYITAQVEAGRKPHVVATPNIEVDAQAYKQAARIFGEKQPYQTDFYTSIIDKCTPAELSGTNPDNGNKVHFNVVFEDYDDTLYGTAAKQAAGLAKLQETYPFLEAPAMLKALAYTFTLRQAQGEGEQLHGPGMTDLTYVRDYTIEPQRLDGDSYVPDSIVYGSGRFFVSYSVARPSVGGRALVG